MDVAGDQTGRQLFNGRADKIYFLDLRDGQVRHEGPPIGDRPDQSSGLQLFQRLPDHGAAAPEPGDEIHLGQALPGFEFA